LLKFSGLFSAVFGCIGHYDLDDRFINDAAIAWPRIRELKFESKRRASCNVTFTAMVRLATRCRSLRALHLAFDATQPTTIYTLGGAPGMEIWPKQTALRQLHIGHSQVSEAAYMPYILERVFPALEEFDWYHDLGNIDLELHTGAEFQEAWGQIMGAHQDLVGDDGHDDGDDDHDDDDHDDDHDDDDYDSEEESGEEDSDDDV
jgi:hypothetical protein